MGAPAKEKIAPLATCIEARGIRTFQLTQAACFFLQADLRTAQLFCADSLLAGEAKVLLLGVHAVDCNTTTALLHEETLLILRTLAQKAGVSLNALLELFRLRWATASSEGADSASGSEASDVGEGSEESGEESGEEGGEENGEAGGEEGEEGEP